MTRESGVTRFWDGIYELPRENFDASEYSRVQANYMLEHNEITALASLFVAHLARKPMQGLNVLKKARYFFTRPVDVLQNEFDGELKRTRKLGPRPEISKKHRGTPVNYPESVKDCVCPSICIASVESVYSSFVTESTSASTLSTVDVQVQLTPTLEQNIFQLLLKAMSNGLNNMYAARERDIIYDEAYICLITCIHKAVEATWNPLIEEIKGFLDTIIDNVRDITTQRHRLKMIMTDKVPIKINKFRNNFKGFVKNEVYQTLNGKQILETMKARKGTNNCYPKDAFAVYTNTWDKSFDISVTREPLDEIQKAEAVAASSHDVSFDVSSIDE